MKNPVKQFATLAIALLAGGSCLFAVPVVSVVNGGIALDLATTNVSTTGAAGDPWVLNETMTSAGTIGVYDDDGAPLPAGGLGYGSGAWISKTVLNSTNDTWTSFEMELQQVLGTPSGEGDGLSFAQGSGLVFTSSVFTTLTKFEVTRDYLNFSGGSVAPGGSVTFTFAVTDNSPSSPIYLLQTPNKIDQPVPDASSTMLLVLAGITGVVGLRRKFC